MENIDNPETDDGHLDHFNLIDKSLVVLANYTRTLDLVAEIKGTTEKEEKVANDEDDDKEKKVHKYLNSNYTTQDGKLVAARNPLEISFEDNGLECISETHTQLPNLLTGPLSKCLVVIEFFTHCCINCIHSIEDVRKVHNEITKTADGDGSLKIISVHSPKFTREKDTESIKAFTERMNMDYSMVVNDPNCYLWNTLGISCWPTLLILGPNPSSTSAGSGMNLLFTLMGEGHKDVLETLLKSSISYFRRRLPTQTQVDEPDHPLPSLKPKAISNSLLKYPGKVAYYNGQLAISDTGNHRLIFATVDGVIKHVVGGCNEGFVDGDFSTCRFHFPQGVAFQDDNVCFLADTGNHSIRKIDLSAKKVSTLISQNWSCNLESETVYLRSPWDLSFYCNDILLVAAAGNHRIFAYFFNTKQLFTTEHKENSFAVVAGTGKEENRNNSYILKASFAQPSGICVSSSKVIYIADSESSSIRLITTEGKGKVSALVGGARDPNDLFSYGDAEGKGVVAKLQHPMGVCADSEEPRIYFVDTYNHKIKVVELGTQVCTTFTGGESESTHSKFNEPSGISIDSLNRILWVADTNNHCIKFIDLRTMETNRVELTGSDNAKPLLHIIDAIVTVNRSVLLKKSVNFNVNINDIPRTFEGGQWRLISADGRKASGKIIRDPDTRSGNASSTSELNGSEKELGIVVDIFVCGTSSCLKKSINFLIQFSDDEAASSEINISYDPSPEFFFQVAACY